MNDRIQVRFKNLGSCVENRLEEVSGEAKGRQEVTSATHEGDKAGTSVVAVEMESNGQGSSQ